MKTLRCISTVVLLCLVFAAPASAVPSIHLSTPESTYLGSPVTYTVSGELESTRKYGVYFLRAEAPGACALALEGHSSVPTTVATGSVPSSGKLEVSGSIPTTLYEALGTYYACASVQTEESKPTETVTSFTVMAPPPPPPVVTPPVTPPVSGPTPTIIPPLAPVSKPLTAAQKLHAALAKCKKQKNKRKRVKCERTAKTAARHH